MPEFRELSIEADFPEGMVSWIPMVSDDGTVGYRVVRLNDDVPTETYVYLVPSSGGDEGAADVFLYIGPTGDASEDEPVHWYEPFARNDGVP